MVVLYRDFTSAGISMALSHEEEIHHREALGADWNNPRDQRGRSGGECACGLPRCLTLALAAHAPSCTWHLHCAAADILASSNS
jgi:hypothetical protein